MIIWLIQYSARLWVQLVYEHHIALELGLRTDTHFKYNTIDDRKIELEDITKRRPLIDIREMDLKGNFGFPDRYYQKVDLR